MTLQVILVIRKGEDNTLGTFIENLISNPIREIIAFFLIVISIVFVLLSYCIKIRNHSLKIIGILIVLSTALFANDANSYFLSIIILATLVTNLDFLENISAILRNSEAYFKYKESQRTLKDVEKSIKEEEEEIEQALESEQLDTEQQELISLNLNKSNLTPIQFGVITEEYTLNYLEQKYGYPIKRYVRLIDSSLGQGIEFDGVVGTKLKDIVLEVKTSRRGFLPLAIIKKTIRGKIESIIKFKNYFKNPVELRFIYVGKFTEEFKAKVIQLVQDFSIDAQLTVKVEFYTFEEIGLKDILNID